MKHSVKFYLTASSGVKNFPEFVGIVLVDDIPMGYCESNGKTPEVTLDWAKKVIEDDPEHLTWYLNECRYYQDTYKVDIDTLKQQLNQSGGKN